jgi:hypothetical protein
MTVTVTVTVTGPSASVRERAGAGTRPVVGGPLQWQLAARAAEMNALTGISPRMWGELMRLLELGYGDVAPMFMYRVSRLAFALHDCADAGSLRLSATSTQLLMELDTPMGQNEVPAVRRVVTLAHLVSVSDSCGSYLTLSETRRQLVHWAMLALPDTQALSNAVVINDDTDAWS